MSLNYTERFVIEQIIKRLRGESNTTPEAAERLEYLSSFLETWVISALELLLKKKRAKYDLDIARDIMTWHRPKKS